MSIKRVRTHGNPLAYHETMPAIDFSKQFPGFDGELDFEVGVGKGVFLRHYALQFPQRPILGVEIRKPLVDSLQDVLVAQGSHNALVLHGSAERCIDDCFPHAMIRRCFVFHPDPWIKKRHLKRRVINSKFLASLKPKLLKGAELYISTDVTHLWEDIQDCMSQDPDFKQVDDTGFWTDVYHTHWAEYTSADQRSQWKGRWDYSPE